MKELHNVRANVEYLLEISSPPHGGLDNASDENNENTRRKATVVPIKIEYV